MQGGITIKKFNDLKKPLNKAFLTLIAVSVVIPFFALNPISAEEPESDFSTEPGTEFYVSEFEKNDDIDLFGNEDIEVLMEQLDEEEIVLEEDALIENVENKVQDEKKIDEISLYKPQFQIFSMASNVEIEPKNNLTMGFLQPTAGTGVNGNIFDGSQSSTVLSYIAADVRYTGVIPFVEKKDGRYRILISGLDGWVDEKGFRAYAVDTKNLRVNHYTPSDGRLFHWISRAAVNPPVNEGGTQFSYDSIGVGDTPSFMTNGVDYYSSDGHYFYTDVVTMLNDYKGNHRRNSINPNNPHYNYFQFLSYRSSSNITANDLEDYLKNVKKYNSVPISTSTLTSNQSMLFGSASKFKEYGETYGGNYLMTFSLAINESGWGRSNLAINKKNLFGHAAYDSDPDNATGYKDVSEGVKYHNQYYINNLYSNTNGNIYKGTYFGDKSSGMNIHYASDPHWGEKAADNYYALNKRIGNKDSDKTEIGLVKTGLYEVFVRKEASTKSNSLYTLKIKNQAVNILGTVDGEVVNGSKVWYKISSDALLDLNRNVVKGPVGVALEQKYTASTNYAYVHSSLIDKVKDLASTGLPPAIKGDVNSDGVVDIFDISDLRRHILKIENLSLIGVSVADVNQDGFIDIFDISDIRRHILGLEPFN